MLLKIKIITFPSTDPESGDSCFSENGTSHLRTSTQCNWILGDVNYSVCKWGWVDLNADFGSSACPCMDPPF